MIQLELEKQLSSFITLGLHLHLVLLHPIIFRLSCSVLHGVLYPYVQQMTPRE